MIKLRTFTKKFIKGSIILFSVFVFLFSIAWASLQSDYVQTKAVNFFSNLLSTSLKSKVTIGEVSIAFFNKLVFYDVKVTSLKNEKIAFASKITASINYFSIKNKNAEIGRIFIKNAHFGIYQNKQGITNIEDWLTDSDSTTDTSSFRWHFSIHSLKMENAGFRYYHEGVKSHPKVFDYENTNVTGINGIIDNINLIGSKVECDISELTFRERCGFCMKSFNGHFIVSDKTIEFSDFWFKTDKSYVYSRFGKFTYNSFYDFADYVYKIKMNCRIVDSKVSMADISCFTEEMLGLDQVVKAKGHFKGTVSDFVVNDASVSLLDSTYFEGNVEMSGLPEIENTYFFIEAKKLKTNIKDIGSIPLYPFVDGNKIPIPATLMKLGTIKYKGNFTGFFNDVVAFGKISTSLGNVSSDILIKQPKKTNDLILSGRFSTDNFRIGAFLDPSYKIGNANMDVNIKTYFENYKFMNSDIKGDVTYVDINSYRYNNMSFDGNISPKSFVGKVSIKDQNLDLDFAGKCDFSKRLPIFDFNAHVGHLNFHRLNILVGDSIADISCSFKTKLTGNNIGNMNGFIKIDSVLFENKKGQSFIEDATISLKNKANHSDIELKSDYVDARVFGEYNIESLIVNVRKSIEYYLPSIVGSSKIDVSQIGNDNLKFNIALKDLRELSKTILPEIELKDPLTINGEYSSKEHYFKISTESPYFKIAGSAISNFSFNLNSQNSGIEYKAVLDMPIFNVPFKGIKAVGGIKNDSVSFAAYWYKDDSLMYRGFVKTLGIVSIDSIKKTPIARFSVLPANIVIADSVWHLSKSSVLIDSVIKLEGFQFSNRNQRLETYGTISNNEKDSLVFKLSNFDLKYFNKFFNKYSLGLKGDITGYVSLFNLVDNFYFHSKIKTTGFQVAGIDYGTLNLLSNWDEKNKSIGINVYSERGNVKPIDLSGFYFPEDNMLDMNLNINNANLNIISVFVKDFFSDIKGYLEGQVRIQGKLSNPEMYGFIDLKKSNLFVDYLNTRYNLSGRCNVRGQKLIFDNIKIFDSEGNPAYANGDLQFGNYNKLLYNIVIDAKKFIGIDTKANNNPYFYGKAYATGVAKIYGDLNHVQIDVSAKSNENTIINIPVYSETTIENNNFLTFKARNLKPVKKVESASFDAITMNFDLEVTPDAEIQIILDEKVGDIIRSKGNGTILMNIDTKGKFNMYGTYEIFTGDYLFTMRNLINKKFFIEPGSKLTWTGNALDAKADIVAKYNIKTSLYPLMSLVNDTSPDYKRRIPIECKITLTDKILKPNIAFSVDMKEATDKAKEVFNNLSEEEKNKQFISLLVLNNFFFSMSNQEQSSSINTTTEMALNQLSNLASNINKNVNVGINYRYGSALTQQSDELELALSTEILDNRVILNVNGFSAVGKTNYTTISETNGLGGDVNVEVKLNKSGTLRAKGFSRSNSQNPEKKSENTQGIGIAYSKSFNTFRELFVLNRRKKTANINNQDK